MKIGFIGGGSVGGSLANLLHGGGHDLTVGLRDEREKRADATYRVAAVADAVETVTKLVPILHPSLPRSSLE